MENKIFSRFNLYDQIGYLLVGGIALLVVISDFYLLGNKVVIPQIKINVSNFIIWVLIAYFVGHIFQAVANIFIQEKRIDFSESEKEILNQVKNYFKIEKQSFNELYSVCYMFSLAKDITGQVQSFNAYYSLYRGWFMIFVFQSVFLLFFMTINWFNLWYLILFITSILIMILFFKRMKRFYQYARSKTLQTFFILSKNIF